MVHRHFCCTHALVRGIPSTFEDGLKLAPPPTPIDPLLAEQQHEAYNQLLRSLVPLVIPIPADDNHPDCVFVEDAIIIIDGTPVACRSGAPSRRGEVGPVVEAVKRELGLDAHIISDPGCIDGGDVCFTGTEVLVGITQRTNEEAVRQLAAIFKDRFPVRGIRLPEEGLSLHLKSLLSAFDENTLIVADNTAGRFVAEQVCPHANTPAVYDVVWVPDEICSNCLRIHDTLVMQEGFPRSEAVLAELCDEKGVTLRKLCMSELAKADGALTCCSVLFHIS